MSVSAKWKDCQQWSGRSFRAIAETVVPELTTLDNAAWDSVTAIITRAVSQRPRRMQRQLGMFLRILNVLSLLRYGKFIHSLAPSVRTTFLANIQNSNLLLFRRGFWGVRTLVLMGYYARPEARSVVGYRAHTRGWEMRV